MDPHLAFYFFDERQFTSLSCPITSINAFMLMHIFTTTDCVSELSMLLLVYIDHTYLQLAKISQIPLKSIFFFPEMQGKVHEG